MFWVLSLIVFLNRHPCCNILVPARHRPLPARQADEVQSVWTSDRRGHLRIIDSLLRAKCLVQPTPATTTTCPTLTYHLHHFLLSRSLFRSYYLSFFLDPSISTRFQSYALMTSTTYVDVHDPRCTILMLISYHLSYADLYTSCNPKIFFFKRYRV